MNNIKISVVMGVYYKDNPENLKEAIKSLINQTVLPDEIILVEDGILTKSLYDTINELKKIDILKIYSQKENKGVASAINFGIKYAKNEYIARMDADDVCRKDRFEKQIKYIMKHPEVDILGGQICEYDFEMKKKIGFRKVPNSHEDIIKRYKYKSPINNITVIIKKSVFNKLNGYNEEYRVMEDYEFYIRAIDNGFYFHNLDDVLVDVRTGKNMYLRRSGIEYIKTIVKIEKMLFNSKKIGRCTYIFNLSSRCIISILPNCIRKIFYIAFLREKEVEI